MEVIEKQLFSLESGSLYYPRNWEDNVLARGELLKLCENNPAMQAKAYELCSNDLVFWIDMFCYTKDPRRNPDVLPFICYEAYQEQYARDIEKAINEQYDCLTEKSRDMGVSWLVLYVFMHKWLFEAGSDFRVGSRKEEFVDRANDIDTLFEKVRFNLKRQPTWLMPQGFEWRKHSTYMKIINPDKGNAIIGESANEDFGSGGRRKAILLDEYSKWETRVADAAWTACYSKDTEALTLEGWKLIKDIEIGDYVYSMNPKNRQAKFMPVRKTYEQYRRELIHFRSKSIDLRVTGNHKIVYETAQGRILFKEAQKVMGMKSGHIPLVSINANRKRPTKIYGFNTGDWLEFLGWYISEGCTSRGGTIIITQSQRANPEKVERIKNLLFQMGLRYSYKGKDFNVNVRGMNKKARKELKALGKCYEKYIPKQYFRLHKDLLLRLWESLFLGDGSDRKRVNRKSNATSYTTTSYQLASDVQALAQIIGYKASIGTRFVDRNRLIMGRQIKSDVRTRYDVYIGYKVKANIDKISKSYIDYYDKVYCVETQYHTLYVRNRDIACWCGNTADVSKCRLPVSTPKGSGNKFALLAKGTKEKIKRLTLHWTLHPDKTKGAYYLDSKNGMKMPIDSPRKAYGIWESLQGKTAEKFGLIGGLVRSIWYDDEAERRSDADLAQEVDIDYLRSGYPFFDLAALSLQRVWKYMVRKLPTDPIPYGNYIRVKIIEIDHKFELRETPGGWLKIYEMPRKDYQYAIGADTSEGLPKGDEAFGVVRDKWTRNVVATFNGLIATDDFALKLQQAGKLYNGAEVAPENNNHGHSVCQDLKNMDCKLYYTKKVSEGTGKVAVIKAGFSTTSTTRPLMLDQLEEEIRRNAIELRDEDIIAQCRTFIKNEKTGKPEADGVFLDDGVIATAICGIIIQETPYKAKASQNIKQAQRVKELQKKPRGY